MNPNPKQWYANSQVGGKWYIHINNGKGNLNLINYLRRGHFLEINVLKENK
jgi:hypothetical protein